MSRCKSNPAKHRRVSKGHGKNNTGGQLNSHKLPLKKHTWAGHGDERRCVHCGKIPDRIRGAVIVKAPYWANDEYQAKMDKITDEIQKRKIAKDGNRLKM